MNSVSSVKYKKPWCWNARSKSSEVPLVSDVGTDERRGGREMSLKEAGGQNYL